MTEDEAKTKWCPFVRLTASAGEWHINRPPGSAPDKPGDYLCMGAACMAWRWYPSNGLGIRIGLCGLAGKP